MPMIWISVEKYLGFFFAIMRFVVQAMFVCEAPPYIYVCGIYSSLTLITIFIKR